MGNKMPTRIRREQIIGAALDLISKDGLSALTIRNVAKKVKVATGNIYRHFSNKDELVAAIISQVDAGLNAIIDKAIEDEMDSVNRLKIIFFSHLAFIEERQAVPRIVFSNEMYGGDSSVSKLLKNVMDNYLRRIRSILRQGVRSGNFSENLDIEAAGISFLGFIQAIVLQWVLFGFSFSLKKRGRRLWKMYLRGIMAG